MTDKIISMGLARADATNDNRMITPAEALMRLADDIESGKVAVNKLVILTLNDIPDSEGNRFQVGYRSAKVSLSEVVTVCAMGQKMAIDKMGHWEE